MQTLTPSNHFAVERQPYLQSVAHDFQDVLQEYFQGVFQSNERSMQIQR